MTDHEFRVWCEAHRNGVVLADVARKGLEVTDRADEWQRKHDALQRLYLTELCRAAEIASKGKSIAREDSVGTAITRPK